jgi:putative ABC transport system permease protein
MDTLLQDLRYALRSLRKSPGFTLVAVLTLALSIGASTAVFTVVHGVLWRPLPYADPDRLVFLWHRMEASGMQRTRIPGPDVAEFRDRATLFEGFAFMLNVRAVALAAGGTTEPARRGFVTANFFSVLGARAAIGQAFDPNADVPQAAGLSGEAPLPPSSIVLGHALWRGRFGGDPGVIGRTVQIDGRPATVVGVMPRGFAVPMPAGVGLTQDLDAWTRIRVPLDRFRRPDGLRDQDSDNTGAVVARLKPGVSLERAQAELDVIAAQQRETVARYGELGMRIEVVPFRDDVVAHRRPLLLALFAAVGLVLLIACVNIANLSLARLSSRRREIALRAALGAGGRRLMRQLMTESGVLAAAGGVGGLLMAAWAVPVLLRYGPDLPRMGNVGVDVTALAFTLGVVAVAAVVFGTVPALVSARERGDASLRPQLAVGTGRAGAPRRALVVAEIALSMVLLVGSGLLLRTLGALGREDPGFDPKNALTFRVSLRAPDSYVGPAARAEFLRQVADRLGALPGVEAVGAIGGLPLSGTVWTQPYGQASEPPDAWERNEADFRVITSGYFEAMGMRLLAGRSFTPDEDLAEERRVAIVDARMARRVAPEGGSVLGRTIAFPLDGRPVTAEIVGVVDHVRYARLDRDGREAIYVPYRQEASLDVYVVVRTTGTQAGLAQAVRREVLSLDSRLPVYDIRAMEEYVGAAIAPTRFALTLMTGFAVLAVVLGCTGLYGVLAFTVSQRTREFGIRLAVGARQADVLLGVLAEGAAVSAVGLALGAVLSLAFAGSLSDLLFGVRTTDPLTFGAVGLLLGAVALIACYLPARRAAKVDPMVALRHE